MQSYEPTDLKNKIVQATIVQKIKCEAIGKWPIHWKCEAEVRWQQMAMKISSDSTTKNRYA
jgi:hypothetical protein